MKRHQTKHPGVFHREAERLGGRGLERVYYIVLRRTARSLKKRSAGSLWTI